MVWLTSTARVARVELWRMWKRRVLAVLLCPPFRDVPPKKMIIGLLLNRLIKWGGSWPWVTRTCKDHTAKLRLYIKDHGFIPNDYLKQAKLFLLINVDLFKYAGFQLLIIVFSRFPFLPFVMLGSQVIIYSARILPFTKAITISWLLMVFKTP